MSVKKIFPWVISLLLTAGLLYLFLRKAHLHSVLEETSHVNIAMVALAIFFEVISILLRSYRWRVMLQSVRNKIPMLPILKATVVSFTLTGLVPGRLGEVGKPFLLSRWEKLPFGPLLASVVLERGMDLLAIVTFWLLYVFRGDNGISADAQEYMSILMKGSYLLLALAIPLGIFLFWLVPRRRVLDRMAKRSERLGRYPFLKKLVRKVLGFVEGLGTFRKKRTILYVFFLSLATWGCVVVSAWAIVRGLHLDIPAGSAILLLVFVSLGAAIPTPGGVGGVHKAIQIALMSFYGVSETAAVSAGILGHAVMFVPGILWGLGYIISGRVKLGELKLVAKASSDASKSKKTLPEKRRP